MHNHNLPATLSPCVRIFLEILCEEATALSPVGLRTHASFAQVVAQAQRQTSIATK
jgi:hypothetical protein